MTILCIADIVVSGDKMSWCLWIIFTLGISFLYSQDVHKHPLVFEKIVTKLFIQEHFIYPLYDVKPIAYTIYSKNEDWRNVLSSSTWSYINYFEFKVIKDYLKENPSSNFFLLEEPNPYCNCAKNVYFVNKTEFINCCNENLQIFKRVLGSSFNPESLLQDLELGTYTLRKSLKNNEQLFGILLGFGAQNSYEFSKLKNGYSHECPYIIYNNFELSNLSEKSNYLVRLTPVLFVGVEGSTESLDLQKKYAQKYRELSRIYSGANSYGKIIDKLYFSEGAD